MSVQFGLKDVQFDVEFAHTIQITRSLNEYQLFVKQHAIRLPKDCRRFKLTTDSIIAPRNRKVFKVKRKVQTKLSSLAMKMVEHGPYEFDFDPTEVKYTAASAK